MRVTRPSAEEPVSLLDARSLDRLCDRFKAAWLAGERPSLDAFLAEVPAPVRADAFRKLVALDVEYRLRDGDTPGPDDYLNRFGEFTAVIHEVLRALHATAADQDLELAAGSSSAARATLFQATAGSGPVPAIPGYELLGELGRGGMGVVYKARQVKAGRHVALKMILSGPHASSEQQARFRTEAEAIARLQHPNIVQVYEVGEHAGWSYFSLEFCGGGSLAGRLAGTPLPLREAAALVERLARAMHAAHQKGVVHRDLKPANVLLTEDGTPKVSDFGLARKLDEAGQTASGAVLGTPSYMAPEQACGRPLATGPATDVYALGAILYECLTGRPPFRAATTLETMRHVCEQEPVAPRSLNLQVARDLETICLRCVEKEPQRRYPSAAALAEDLRRFLAGDPIEARPPSALRRTAYWLRRHPVAAVTLAASALLVVAVTLSSLWYSAQLAAALEGKEKKRLEADQNKELSQRSEARANHLAYVSDVRLASQLLRTGDIYHLADLLDRHVPAAGADDQREFTWFYANQFSRPTPPPTLQAHRGHVTAASFSGDGRLLATAGWDGTARVWQLPEGNCWRTVDRVAGVPVPYPDGRTLAVVPAHQRRAVRLVDIASGEQRALLKDAAASEIGRLLLSADGKTLAAVSAGAVHLWDAQTLRPRGQISDPGDEYLALALSPAGETLATVGRNDPCVVRLRDVATGAVRREVRFEDRVLALAYAPVENLLAVSRQNGNFSLLRAERNRLVEAQYGHAAPAGGVLAFSPDGRLLALGAADEVCLWDVGTATFRNRLRWQPSAVSALAFSPDGQVLAVGTQAGLLHRVNPNGPATHDTLRADLRPSGPLAVSHDGTTLALPDEDGTVKLVDAGSGEVRRALPGHGGCIADCVFSLDDRTLATVGLRDAEIRLWDTTTGRERKGFTAGTVGLRCLAFSPSGGLLAAGEDGDTVWVWDLATGAVRGKLTGHGANVRDLVFSADGRLLASCSGAKVVRLWDAPSQGVFAAAPREQLTLAYGADALAFGPTGRTLAVGEASGAVSLVQIPEAGPVRQAGRLPGSGADACVTNLGFSPDGRTLLVGRNDPNPHSDARISVWDVTAGQHRTCFRHCSLNPGLHCGAWIPDGRLVLQSAGGDVLVHDLAATSARVLPRQALWAVQSLAFSPDGKSLYLGTAEPLGETRYRKKAVHLPFASGDQWLAFDHKSKGDVADSVRVWDVASLRPGPRLPGEESMALPGRIALSADGRLLAAGGPDGSVRLWDLAARRLSKRLFINRWSRDYAASVEWTSTLIAGKPEYTEGVECLSFSPDGRWLAAAGEQGTVTLWETDGWQEHRPLEGTPVGTAWVGFGPDSTLAIARKGQVRLFDPRTGEVRATLGTETDPPILCGAFASDGQFLVTGTAAQTVRVWDLRTGRPRRDLSGHMHQVAAVTFSPDGRTLASGDWSGALKLWSVATLQEVASLPGHSGRVRCLAFSPDGQTLATGAENGPGKGEVFLWRAPRRPVTGCDR